MPTPLPRATPVAILTTPDAPVPFGYKTCWLALKTDAPAEVAVALQLQDLGPANWESGIRAAHGLASRTFITPAVGGWVLAVDAGMAYPVDTGLDGMRAIGQRFDAMFQALAEQFDEALFFGTHRVSGFDAWARARHGAVERVFGWADGQLLANRGVQTQEERQLGLLDLDGRQGANGEDYLLECDEARERARAAHEQELIASGVNKDDAWRQAYRRFRSCYPSEDDTVDLAMLWSVDPRTLDDTAPSPSLGLVGTPPSASTA